MKNVLAVIKHELHEAMLPFIFFFIVFHLLAATNTLLLAEYQITVTSMTVATILALIGSKAVLIADKLPFIDPFQDKPLVFSVLWKTVIYGALFFLFRCIEELIPLLSKYDGLGPAVKNLVTEISWPNFWALQIWLTVSLILYNAITGLDKRLGAGTVKKVFLG